MDIAGLIKSLVTLFVVIDPIGSIPVYLYATASVPAELHRAFAVRAVLIAGGVLLFFLVCGQLLLEGLGLRLGVFQISGGIILFLFALQMIFGESKPSHEISEAQLSANEHLSGAAFPLAMPSLASPGAILAIVVLTDNHVVGLLEQAQIAALMIAVLAITLGFLLIAGNVIGLIGSTGASVISRVMGLILATIAADSIFVGLEQLALIHLS